MRSSGWASRQVLVPGLGVRLAGHDATPVPLASSVARLAAWHYSRGEVVDVGGDAGQEATREDRRHVVGVVGQARIGGAA